MTDILRVIESTDRSKALLELCECVRGGGSDDRLFYVNPTQFEKIPTAPFAYWVSDSVIRCFSDLPPFSDCEFEAWVGLQTNHDFQWVRTWWENVERSELFELSPFFKGGSRSPYYSDVYLGIRWGRHGRLIKSWKQSELLRGAITANNSQCWNEKNYFHPGVAWPSRTLVFSPRALPRGCVFAHKGPAAFSRAGDAQALLMVMALMNEFVFDLPVALPEALKGVPHAPQEARPIVDDVCERLRADPKWRAHYIDRAEAVESEIDLPSLCQHIDDLGQRDTFPFEERTFLRAAIRGITVSETDVVRGILARNRTSVWVGKGESQAQWELVRAALGLVEACDDLERQLSNRSRSQSELIDFYLASLREADRLQREFEQAVGEILDQDGLLGDVIDFARASYRRLAEKVQVIFVRHLESTGWPPSGRLANAAVFDRMVGERLKDRGRRVAYFMVDALRYELGVALERLLAEDGPVELQAAYATLPTITPVGMASLLPNAESSLKLTVQNECLVPKIGDAPVTNVGQRMEVIRRLYGDRFRESTLNDFVRTRPKIPETVDLLVLRSTEIDSQLENNPETTLGLIPNTLKLIRVALHKLRGSGFNEAVIVTDHGFFLNAQAEAGDVCAKPQGKWVVNAHDRIMLGAGNSDGHSLVMSTARLGIKSDAEQAALPRSMAPYRAGHLYFHGGASLQEAVVPVLVAKLDAPIQRDAKKVSVELIYRNGLRRITTQVPVVDIMVSTDDMFSRNANIEIMLEAQDSRGTVVGEPRPGGEVNPATRTVTLMPGQRKQIALRMDDEFRGKFFVKAMNPSTLVAYAELALETDYTE